MTGYISIQLSSDEECPLWFLRNALFAKLHKAIYDLNANDIAVSFPQAKQNVLGSVIRIHSAKEKLVELQNLNWLGGLSGYCKVSEVLPVPDKIKGYQNLSRIRQNMTDSKLKKRIEYQKEQGILSTDDEIRAYVKQYKNKMFKTGLSDPYLELQSVSTQQKYRIYIKFSDLLEQAIDGEFNRFGLSKTATVPVF